MEEESFDREDVAEALNRDFISVKVDKEERPDIDAVYMAACQAFTGQGGWPTTVLLTPDQKPFFAGTYFPRESGYGQTGLLDLLRAAKEAWSDNPQRLRETGEQVVSLLSGESQAKAAGRGAWAELREQLLEKARAYYEEAFDPVWGGFGGAPKFPAAHNLLLLLKLHEKKCPLSQEREAAVRSGAAPGTAETKELEMAERTLQQMYAGGLYDHVGFGFCRYSTDEKWLVPHFEKMLYDNALLSLAYTECWRITGKPFYLRAAEEIFEYVMREMRSPEGGFYSSQDADSGGEEGGYYVFTPEEVCAVLGEERGGWFNSLYGIAEPGNFEGNSIPNLIDVFLKRPEIVQGLSVRPDWAGEESAEDRGKRRDVGVMKRALRGYRRQRADLRTDDKILTSWNSLMIAALARAYQVFEKKEYLTAAQEAERFLRERLTKEDGGLYVRCRDGEAAGSGFLDDYAFYEWALLELLCASHRASYLQRAMEVQDKMLRDFWDEERGGFSLIGKNHEPLIYQPKETYDGAMPSGNAAAAYAMICLAKKLGKTEERDELIERQLSFLAENALSHPAAHSFGLLALMEWERLS